MEERNMHQRDDIRRPIVACSTGAITRWPDLVDDYLLDRWYPKVDTDAFEVMFYDSWYPRADEISSRLTGLGLDVVAVHAEKDIGSDLVAADRESRVPAFDRFAANCRFANRLGANVLVLHLWGLPDGDARLDQQLDVLPRLIDIADGGNVQLGIEAIPCTIGTPLENVQRVIAADSRARIVLDTEFLAMHNELDLALRSDWLWVQDRVVHVHVKDFDGVLVDSNGKRRYLHPGEGKIAFDSIFSALAKREYCGPIALESTAVTAAGDVDIERLNRSLARLRRMVQSAWG